MSILGNRVLRTEDPKFLTVGGTYVADVDLPAGRTVVVFVRSTMAHAELLSIDLDEARDAPGVVGVFTADDLDIGEMPPAMGMLNAAMGQPLLATGRVRYVGEPVVAIVAETLAPGMDAAEPVFIDYEPLPTLVDPAAAVDGDILLFPEAGTNVAMDLEARGLTADLSDCEVVVTQTMHNQRVAPVPIEGRVTAAYWNDEGRLVHYASSQGAHPVRDALSERLGVPPEQIQVISPDVGGGFGAKGRVYPEDVLVAWLARAGSIAPVSKLTARFSPISPFTSPRRSRPWRKRRKRHSLKPLPPDAFIPKSRERH